MFQLRNNLNQTISLPAPKELYSRYIYLCLHKLPFVHSPECVWHVAVC